MPRKDDLNQISRDENYEMKSTLDGINSRLETAEGRISGFGGRAIGTF